MQAFHLLGSAPFYTNSFLLLTKAGHAVIIDPAAGVQEYDKILRDHGAVLTHILCTHGHYDHVGSAGVLSRAAELERLNGRASEMHRKLEEARATEEASRRELDAAQYELTTAETQRRAAEDRDIVAEGRDIGTVVFPNAQVKVFLTADPRERARRRVLQRHQNDAQPLTTEQLEAEVDETLDALKQRDKLDSSREVAPLVPAEDAVHVDSTAHTIDEVVRIIEDLINQRR